MLIIERSDTFWDSRTILILGICKLLFPLIFVVMYDSFANFSQDLLILGVLKAIAPTNGGLISYRFSLWLKSPNKGAKSLS